jgi:AraC-like DNA-binding protein
MAAAVAYLTQAMADLARQLAFAPAAAARKHVTNALALVSELEPDQSYPMGFVTFRVTGFRVDRGVEDLVPGAAIRTDLCTFVLEVSRRAPVVPDQSTGAVVTIAELAERWSVSERTLRRWRRFGLALEWFERDGDEPILGVRESIASGVQMHQARIVARAGKFRRLAPAERRTVIEAVAREAQRAVSLAQAQRSVAAAHGITAEAVRLIWQASGASAGRTTRPDGWFARCASRGIPLSSIAQAAGLSTAHTARRIVADRAARLAQTIPHVPALPTFVHAEASSVLLGAPWLEHGLVSGAPVDVVAASVAHPKAVGRDFTVLAALRFLLWRARTGVVGPIRPGTVERAEVDVRWAAMLLRTLVAWHTPGVLQRLAAMVEVPVTQLPADPLRRAVELAQACIVHAAFQIDLSTVAPHRLRIDRVAQLAFEQQLVRQPNLHATGRASAMHPQPIQIGDAVQRASPWIGAIAPGCGQRIGAALLGGQAHDLLAAVHGWRGNRPRSLEELAQEHGVSRGAMQVRVAEAADAARCRWRASLELP